MTNIDNNSPSTRDKRTDINDLDPEKRDCLESYERGE
jgi:hypothetical protein